MIFEETAKLCVELPDEQAGRIFKAVCKFYINGEIVELDNQIEQATLSGILEKVTRSTESYMETCKRKSESAKERHKRERREKEEPPKVIHYNAL